MNCWGLVERLGLTRERVRTELMGMFFKSARVHLRCEVLGPCGEAGACLGRGSELNSWGCSLNPPEFIYTVKCWGIVKGMGLA